jgi:hypothetical protein
MGVAVFASLIQGAIMPVFAGLLLSKVLNLLSIPMAYLKIIFPEYVTETGEEILEKEINFYCSIMAILAVISFIAIFS